nr:MAG TPA: hypothetical protein [Microviridae sp.]
MLPTSPYRVAILRNYFVMVFITTPCGLNLESNLVTYHA